MCTLTPFWWLDWINHLSATSLIWHLLNICILVVLTLDNNHQIIFLHVQLIYLWKLSIQAIILLSTKKKQTQWYFLCAWLLTWYVTCCLRRVSQKFLVEVHLSPLSSLWHCEMRGQGCHLLKFSSIRIVGTLRSCVYSKNW